MTPLQHPTLAAPSTPARRLTYFSTALLVGASLISSCSQDPASRQIEDARKIFHGRPTVQKVATVNLLLDSASADPQYQFTAATTRLEFSQYLANHGWDSLARIHVQKTVHQNVDLKSRAINSCFEHYQRCMNRHRPLSAKTYLDLIGRLDPGNAKLKIIQSALQTSEARTP